MPIEIPPEYRVKKPISPTVGEAKIVEIETPRPFQKPSDSVNPELASFLQAVKEVNICGETDEDFETMCLRPLGHPGFHGFQEDSGAVKLFCRNATCKNFGGWIERRADVIKNRTLEGLAVTFDCDICKQAMKR